MRVPPEARREEAPLEELAAGHGELRELTPGDDHRVDVGRFLNDRVDA